MKREREQKRGTPMGEERLAKRSTQALIDGMRHAIYRKCWDIVEEHARELRRREDIAIEYTNGIKE